jgi:hypothetical protein
MRLRRFSEDVEWLALLTRLQWWFNAAAIAAVVACAALRLLGVTGAPLLASYVLIGASVTLASCAYFQANILRYHSGYMIPAAALAMSTAILADQIAGGAIMDFNLPLTISCASIALVSLILLALFGRSW